MLDCQGGHVCGGFEACASSQAEADRMNGDSGCQIYVYCPASDADAGDAGDASVADVATDSPRE